MSTSRTLAASITKAASRQTYYTIRFLVDRDRVAEAYKTYAYFRWVDDILDNEPAGSDSTGACTTRAQRMSFLERQKELLEGCYRGAMPADASPAEHMLIDLVRSDCEQNSGLQCYLRNMMQVMEFDAGRRGRLISSAELNDYTRWLATAVTEAMHYFIGHGCASPPTELRYLAVSGAHISHMLRDTIDDVRAGYYNIPRELLVANDIEPHEIHHPAYRAWTKSRVQLARQYFEAGRRYLARVEEPRCRLAGLAYTARFEWLLDAIESEDYFLRPDYGARRRPGAALRMGLSTLSNLLRVHPPEALQPPSISQSFRKL